MYTVVAYSSCSDIGPRTPLPQSLYLHIRLRFERGRSGSGASRGMVPNISPSFCSLPICVSRGLTLQRQQRVCYLSVSIPFFIGVTPFVWRMRHRGGAGAACCLVRCCFGVGGCRTTFSIASPFASVDRCFPVSSPGEISKEFSCLGVTFLQESCRDCCRDSSLFCMFSQILGRFYCLSVCPGQMD